MGPDSQGPYPASPQTGAKLKAKLSNIDQKVRMNATHADTLRTSELKPVIQDSSNVPPDGALAK